MSDPASGLESAETSMIPGVQLLITHQLLEPVVMVPVAFRSMNHGKEGIRPPGNMWCEPK